MIHSQRGLWRPALLVFLPVLSLALIGPTVVRGIHETRVLEANGKRTEGIVIGHETDASGRACSRHRLDVAFYVKGVQYKTQARGCGALPDRMPIGRAVDVLYLPSNPLKAKVLIEDVVNSRPGWIYLTLLIGFIGVCWHSALVEWRKLRRLQYE